MSRDGDVMFRAFDSGSQAKVTAGLARDFVAVTPKQSRQMMAAEVTRQSQAGMNSSLTKCRRMRLGLSFSSEWQRTASCTFFFSSSSVFRFRIHRVAQCQSFEPTFERFLNRKNNSTLGYWLSVNHL
jgi:hypothetical protein